MKSLQMPRILLVLIFVTVSSAFLYVANLVVFQALASIFSLVVPIQLMLLGWALAILSGSFIFSTMLGIRFYNTFTRLYYLLSAVWIGFFTYLFFASVLYGFSLVVPGLPVQGIGYLLVSGAFAISIYGVIHARRIQISDIKIALPNLPEAWKRRKAILISDVHLGQLYGPAYARKILKKVNVLQHDIIFIVGDLYDGTGAADITQLVAPLGEFSGKLGIYFVTGNHEEIGESTAFVSAVRAAGIRPLMNEMVEIDGLQLIGVDYRDNVSKQAFRETLSKFFIHRDKPSILLKHEPKDVDVARNFGVSLLLSGHTHQAQLWPLGYIANLIYKGFSYGLNRAGDMQVLTSSGVGTWGPPMRVGTDCEIVHITFV
jgi:hypothetical protein